MKELGLAFLLIATAVAVIAILKRLLPSYSHISPDGVVEFSMRCLALDATIPKDGMSELQRAAESAIHLPGRIAPR